MKIEDEKILREFINNIYKETTTTTEAINPRTGGIIKTAKLDFENNVLKSFYIDNTFKDIHFININKNMENEVVDWLDNKNKENNTFISVNAFKFISKDDYIENKANATTKAEKNKKYVPFRRTGNTVFFSNIIFVDLDFYHTEKYKDKTVLEMYNIIKKEQNRFLKALGAYCFICSGGGLYLLVKFSKTLYFLNDEYKNLWKNISLGINNRFAKYGADTKCKGDFARIFRCPYSYNNKHNNMKQVYIIENFDLEKARDSKSLYKLVKKDLDKIEIVAINKIDKTKKEKKEKVKIKQERETVYNEELIIKNNTNDNWHISQPLYLKNYIDERLWDLDVLLYLRDYNLTGDRNYFFFIYSSILNCKTDTTEETYNCLVSLNNKLVEPLHYTELIHIVNNISTNFFKFTNKKIADLLNITKEESSKLYLSYSEKEKKEQHNKIANESYYRIKKISKLEKKKEKIIDILQNNKNASIKELMFLTKLSRAQLYRYLQKIA